MVKNYRHWKSWLLKTVNSSSDICKVSEKHDSEIVSAELNQFY